MCVCVMRCTQTFLSSLLQFENNPKMTLSVLYNNVSMSMPFSACSYLFISLVPLNVAIISDSFSFGSYILRQAGQQPLSSNCTTSSGPRTAACMSLKWEKGL